MFAATSAMGGVSADAAGMGIGAGIPEGAGGLPGPVETVLLATGIKHGMLALLVWGESHQGLSCCGLFLCAVGWKVS
jgi:hypothetical protein